MQEGAAAVAKNIPIRRLILPQEQPSADIQALLKNTKAQLIYAERWHKLFPGQYCNTDHQRACRQR